MNLTIARNTLIFLFSFSLTLFSHASTSPVEDDTVSDFEEGLVETDKVVSDWFNSVTEGVDLFLVGKKIVKKPNGKSHIVVTNTSYSRESENFSNLTSISVNPRLPNLEAYWNLKFSTYDDTNIGDHSQGGYARQTPQDKKYAATIGLFRKLKDIRISFQPRIELQDPLKVSHFLTAETVLDYKTYQLNPKFQVFADATVGTGSFQALNLNIPLNDAFSFAMLNESEYQERIHKFSVTNGFSLGQVITDTQALSYGINFYSNSQPTYHLDAYSISATWTEILIKKILDYQLTPHVDFVQDKNFHGFVGLIFELNFRF